MNSLTSKVGLSTHVALALTARLTPKPHRIGDVRLIANGRLHLLPQVLHEGDLAYVAKFLLHRPDVLAEDSALKRHARAVIHAAEEFRSVGDGIPDDPWLIEYEPVPGAPLEQRLTKWLGRLDRMHQRVPSVGVGGKISTEEIRLETRDKSYRIPIHHAPTETSNIEVETSPGRPALQIDAGSLRSLARAIDESRPRSNGVAYEAVAMDQFFARFQDRAELSVEQVAAGRTSLAVAPTGTGKSVFTRLLAIEWASRGLPVALIVPNIAGVWGESRKLERAIARAGLDLTVAPLSSWRSVPAALEKHFSSPPQDDKDGLWALGRVGYSCLLSAYQEAPRVEVPFGEEPCTSLRSSSGGGGHGQRVPCPFREVCGRFNPFRRAAKADIVVANHHTLLSGKVPVKVHVDGGAPRSISSAELIMRRCAAVFIDEVDSFQQSAVGATSSALGLSPRRSGHSAPVQLYLEISRLWAESDVEVGSPRLERERKALLRIMGEADRLAELLSRRELVWPKGSKIIWLGARDHIIAQRLFPDDPRGIAKVRELYDDTPLDKPWTEGLRLALARLADLNPADTGEVHGQIRQTLISTFGEDSSTWVSEIVNLLILRSSLLQLDRGIGNLRPQLIELELRGVRTASTIRDKLLGYAPWQPSPAGPLGQRLYGYTYLPGLGGGVGSVEVRILSGDPHGFVRELGGLVSRALCGHERIVVGFSATCRFRGSPSSDVVAPLLGAVSDESNTVFIEDLTQEHRVSGQRDRFLRMKASREGAATLYNRILKHVLTRQMESESTAGRARALLVTNSYEETEAVYRGLKEAKPTLALRYMVRSERREQSDGDSVILRNIESFGAVAAPAILVGPLSVLARGHNILQPGTSRSAISTVFVMTRPLPPSDSPERFLAHLSYNAALNPPAWRHGAQETVTAERSRARLSLDRLQRSSPAFGTMDLMLRRELVCDILVELAQLAGRARRGGTPVRMFFVDNAFESEVAPWCQMVHEVMQWWKASGWLDEMLDLHGAYVRALAQYSGFNLPTTV